jgi:probable phosphoglycerate mutase
VALGWIDGGGLLTISQSTVTIVEIVLIRHGQPEWVREGMNVVNPPLTGLGHRQAKAMARRLASEAFDEILVSPLERARQTAAPLYEETGRDELIEPWLEEIRDPGWHGSPAEKAEQAYREMRQRPVEQRWHGLDGGESIRDFTHRIHVGASVFLSERGVERVDHELPMWSIVEPGRRIALVAHAGTNSVAIAHLLGLPPTPWEWDRFVLGHTSVSRLEAIPVHGGFTFSLTSLSNLEHLASDERTR